MHVLSCRRYGKTWRRGRRGLWLPPSYTYSTTSTTSFGRMLPDSYPDPTPSDPPPQRTRSQSLTAGNSVSASREVASYTLAEWDEAISPYPLFGGMLLEETNEETGECDTAEPLQPHDSTGEDQGAGSSSGAHGKVLGGVGGGIGRAVSARAPPPARSAGAGIGLAAALSLPLPVFTSPSNDESDIEAAVPLRTADSLAAEQDEDDADEAKEGGSSVVLRSVASLREAMLRSMPWSARRASGDQPAAAAPARGSVSAWREPGAAVPVAHADTATSTSAWRELGAMASAGHAARTSSGSSAWREPDATEIAHAVEARSSSAGSSTWREAPVSVIHASGSTSAWREAPAELAAHASPEKSVSAWREAPAAPATNAGLREPVSAWGEAPETVAHANDRGSVSAWREAPVVPPSNARGSTSSWREARLSLEE